MTATQQPVLCIDIGGTSTKSGIVSADGRIRVSATIESKAAVGRYFAGLVSLIQQAQDLMIAEHGHTAHRLGVAVAGFLDPERKFLLYNSNLSWLENFPLKQRLSEAFPELTIELEVDSNAAALAEYRFGSGLGHSRFLCVTAGTGLGVGMTVDGKPLRFAFGCMGDIGHVIVQRNGPLCTCGGHGCAEIMVGSPVVAERYRSMASIRDKVSLRDVIAAADRGDQIAADVLANAGEWLGIAIASMANILFPDHIAIAGGLSAAGDYVLGPAERTFRENACTMAQSAATFSKATLGPLAPLIGAACAFWE